MTQQWILLGAFLFFIALVLTGKAKIHVAALSIPIILELTGVLTFEEAWNGLTNSSVIMMASMFVVAAGLNKTDLIGKLSLAVIRPGSSDLKILFGLLLPVMFLGSVVNATATMTIMIPIVMQVCAEQRKPLSRFMYPVMIFTSLWVGFIPTGGNAGGYLAQNAIVEKLGGAGHFTYFTNMLVKGPYVAILTLLALFVGIKLTPDNNNVPALHTESAAGEARGAQKKGKELAPTQQKLAKIIFGLTIVGIVTCALLKVSTWYPSLVGAFLMVLTGVLDDREGLRAMVNPVIFIFVGTLPMATALNKTGADKLLANTFSALTGNMNPLLIMICMYFVCMVLTQFMTNSAVSNVFKMISAVIAIQSGYNPMALMLAATEGASNAYLMPTAAPIGTMIYDAGGYSLKQYFKLGILYSLVRFVIFVIWVPLLYPLV